MHSWKLEREELDELVQRLSHSEFTDGDDVEDARWLRAHVGKVGFLQLGWAYQGSMFLCESSTEWYDRYQHLLEVSEDFGGIPIDEPDQDDESKPCAGNWLLLIQRACELWLMSLRDLPGLPFSGSSSNGRGGASIHTLARLLIRRGVTRRGIRRSLPYSVRLSPPRPEQMTGLRAAVDRIEAAIEHKEPILIYGDYDVDGTMAVIILKTAIELCGGTADFHVPHRIREGYDMRDDVIERAAAAGIRLIISVDMGIRAFAPAETAHRLGVDLIVTDHHLPGPDGVPKAHAVVNPNQSGCNYPYKQLCGAGVAFKVAQGLMQRRLAEKDQTRILLSFMKVVAIATIADAVPLTGENRVFAKLGLDALRRAVNPGLKALLEVAQISTKRPPTSTEVAFRIAPRINAAGRMDVARDVIELFSVKDPDRARLLAGKLDRLNAERQEEERRILRSIRIAGDEAVGPAVGVAVKIDGFAEGRIFFFRFEEVALRGF